LKKEEDAPGVVAFFYLYRRFGKVAPPTMKETSNISKRIMEIVKAKKFKNLARLSAYMGYGTPEKLYRLRRDPDARPALDMIEDFAKKFPDLNIRWLITGEGKPFRSSKTV